MRKKLNILAVGDPAVYVYIHPSYQIVARYMEKEKIEVNFDIVPWETYYDFLQETFEGKRNYDIVMVAGHLWLYDFVRKNLLAPVEYPQEGNYDFDDILASVRREMRIDDKTFLYPSFCDGHMILYRKSIVKKVLGKFLDEIITTDQLISYVKAVHGEKGMYGIALKAHPSEIFLDILPYFRNEGVEIFDETTCLPKFNETKGIIAVEKYLSLRQYAPGDTGNFGNEEVRLAFQKRKAIFIVTWGGQLGQIINDECDDIDDIGFSTFNTSWNVVWSFGINAKTLQKEDANKFLVYLTTKEIDRIVGSYAGSPVRYSTYRIDKNKYPWYELHLNMVENISKPLPQVPNLSTKLGYLYKELTNAFRNLKTPAEALNDAEKSILLC
ncbi:MAG: extracellular solute-binding protein [Thermoanaerobacter sp.]|nr:extracellular solute-binding protein [Thermoanaerobacter sp.]